MANKQKNLQKKTLIKINKLLKDQKIQKLIDSGVCWLKVKSIKKANEETVYDLEVKPNKKNIENFLGGNCGIILHNSGYPSDPITQAFIKKNFKKYPDIMRKSWKTYQNLVQKEKQKTLF